MKIRFCEHNKGKGKVLRRLEDEFPDLNIKIKSCVKQCGTCRDQPVAVVDKVKVTGKDGDDLYAKIIELIRNDTTSE
ncbi:MAG: DUF1450 domain-containing protein [Desulfuromonadaceae bacterium]|nr:DUF1450 domain-containing protein [Desulfuromonadaceae bacterium]MDD2847793.1 DUF1450 domain-containing protein [Desulfuromonadaceae bacterium]MDD4129662.1 DUF1450 domain-containing protein [Desulfuromonadaceae bacterium]